MNFVEIIVFLFFLAPAILIVCYHLFLGGIGLKISRTKHQSRVCKTNFAILIPAHNEELSIETAICSLKEIDYPPELFTIYVVSDNCTDKTAEIAERAGAIVIVRNDDEKRGKGYALNDAIPRILEEKKFDGIFFMDADSLVDPHVLRSLDYFTKKNAGSPLQINSSAKNPEETALSYFLAVANTLENDFFYAPKSVANLFVLLRGTGMYFPANILKQFAWNPDSLVEDLDLTLDLLRNDIYVRYIPEAGVYSEYPEERKSMNIQRKRWIGGTVFRSLTVGIPMFLGGFFKADKMAFDAGITLMVISRPLILFQLILTTMMSLCMIWPLDYHWGVLFFIAVLCCWIGHGGYFALGVFRHGLTPQRTRFLLSIPMELLKYLMFSARSLFFPSAQKWERTPRKGEKGESNRDVL